MDEHMTGVHVMIPSVGKLERNILEANQFESVYNSKTAMDACENDGFATCE